ncbi:MAG TPA: SPOR domain-containing protein [Thermoleophilaceae bacterium]
MTLPNQPSAPTAPSRSPWETCDHCNAPLDQRQRYCVVCGTKHAGVDDPVARHLTARARRPRPGAPRAAESAARSSRLTLAAVLALLPIAAAIGVQVGRSGSSPDDQVLEALRAQKAPIVKVTGGGAGAATAAAAVKKVTSTFPLDHGFAVRLRKLPSGTSAADVSDAVKQLKSKGAGDVSVVAPADYTVKPSSGSGYTLVSGHFKDRAGASAALKRLKQKFPAAVVVELTSRDSGKGAEGKVVSSGRYGDAHELTGGQPTAQQVQQGKEAVDKVVHSRGKAYVEQQQGLPDVIPVP